MQCNFAFCSNLHDIQNATHIHTHIQQFREHHENLKMTENYSAFASRNQNDFPATTASLSLYRDVAFMKIYDTIFAQQWCWFALIWMLYKYTQKEREREMWMGVVERWFKIAFMSTLWCSVIRDERDNFPQHIFCDCKFPFFRNFFNLNFAVTIAMCCKSFISHLAGNFTLFSVVNRHKKPLGMSEQDEIMAWDMKYHCIMRQDIYVI